MSDKPQPAEGELYDSFIRRWWAWWDARLERLAKELEDHNKEKEQP